jgi:hypothetical protein
MDCWQAALLARYDLGDNPAVQVGSKKVAHHHLEGTHVRQLIHPLAGAVLLLGCLSAAAPTTAPSTMPAASVAIADARPLSEFEGDEGVTTFTDKLRPPLAKTTVYFGEVDVYDGDDDDDPSEATPLIGVKEGDTFKAVTVPSPAAANTGWRYVAAGPAPGSIWGCLDTVAGDSGWSVIVAHSTDGGATFAFKIFRKPCREGSFYDFGMTRDGHGKMTIALDTDCGRHKAGLYHFDTTDAGATWSAEPRFEPDAMIHSESVPDEEQPDGGRTTMKAVFKPRDRRR